MLVKTKYFGEIDITEDKIITMDRGLMGFEQYTKYTILYDSEKETTTISWFQSLEEPTLALPVINPLIVKPDYNPVVILLTMTVPADIKNMTVNLMAPIIVNSDTRKGAQIIVDNKDYEIKYKVYDKLKGDEDKE